MLDQVAVLFALGVEALGGPHLEDVIDHHRTLVAGVGGDHPQRGLEGMADDPRPRRLVTGERQGVDRGTAAQQGHPAARDDAVLDRRAGRRQRILDSRLALLHLDLGGGTDLENGDAADQPCQPLLQLLAIPVGVGLLDLLLDLGAAGVDRRPVTGALDHGGVVLGHHDAASAAELLEPGVLQPQTPLLADHLAAGDHGEVLEHRLAAITETRSLDGDGAEGAAQLVDHQGGEGLALDILGDHEQRAAGLHHPFEHRQQVVDRAHLAVGDENQGVLEHRLHGLGIGDHVRRDVAAVELHPLDHLDLGLHPLAILDRDHAVAADPVEGVGDHLADGLVTGADGGNSADVLATADRGAAGAHRVGHRIRGRQDTDAQRHRRGAGGEVVQPLGDHRARQHGGGGGAVAGDVVGLGGDLLDQLRPHVLEVVLELEVAGNGRAVVGDLGWSELLVQHHAAPARAEGDGEGVGERVDAAHQRLTSVDVVAELLGRHRDALLLAVGDDGEDVLLGQDQVLDVVDLDLTAGVLREDHLVADGDVEGDALAALLVEATVAHRLDQALLGLLPGRVREHDAALGDLLALEGLDDDTIGERTQVQGHRFRPPPQMENAQAAGRCPGAGGPRALALTDREC